MSELDVQMCDNLVKETCQMKEMLTNGTSLLTNMQKELESLRNALREAKTKEMQLQNANDELKEKNNGLQSDLASSKVNRDWLQGELDRVIESTVRETGHSFQSLLRSATCGIMPFIPGEGGGRPESA